MKVITGIQCGGIAGKAVLEMPVSHVATSSRPGCSPYNPSPFSCAWESSGEQPKCLDTCTHAADPQAPGFTLAQPRLLLHLGNELAPGRQPPYPNPISLTFK